eukprot:jgi/Ulvmu1/12574/UM092_0004.1
MNSQDGQEVARSSSTDGREGGEGGSRSDDVERPGSQGLAQEDEDETREETDKYRQSESVDAADDERQNDNVAEAGARPSYDHSDPAPGTGQLTPEHRPSVVADDDDLPGMNSQQQPRISHGSGHSEKSVMPNPDLMDPDIDAMDAQQLRQLVTHMRQDHEQQLQAEERARSEVEDMCLRIEKHFKAEKAARAKAEELMQQAIENELAIKSQLDMEHQRLSHVENDIEHERDKVRQERDALESMRLDFEHELQQAQAEVAKAQDALKTAEDRVRAVEQVERQKIISDYEMRLMALANELVRANNETQLRTSYMSREVSRYQQAAAASANAMDLAKREMHERRADVDAMRTKLDSVMERLFNGSQANMILQANMTAGQDHAGQLFADPQAMTAAGLATLMPGAKMDAHALTQPLLLGATTHVRGGKNGAFGDAGAPFGKFTVTEDAPGGAGAYGGRAAKAPRGAAATGAGKGSGTVKRSGGDGSSGAANKSRQLPPLQSSAPPAQAHQTRHSDTVAQAGGPGNGKTTRRKAAAGAPDRFHGSQVRNEYIMAETMANW